MDITKSIKLPDHFFFLVYRNEEKRKKLFEVLKLICPEIANDPISNLTSTSEKDLYIKGRRSPVKMTFCASYLLYTEKERDYVKSKCGYEEIELLDELPKKFYLNLDKCREEYPIIQELVEKYFSKNIGFKISPYTYYLRFKLDSQGLYGFGIGNKSTFIEDYEREYTEVSFINFCIFILSKLHKPTTSEQSMTQEDKELIRTLFKEGDENIKSILKQRYSLCDLVTDEPKSREDLVSVSGYTFDEAGEEVFKIDEEEVDNAYTLLYKTRKQAESALAYAQLTQFRHVFNKGWEPDWHNINETKFAIVRSRGLTINTANSAFEFLSFKTRKKAEKFLEYHEDLIKKFFLMD